MAAPPSVTPTKSKKEQEQEQLQAEAKEHLKTLEGRVVIKPQQELAQSAINHRDKNACTVYDEGTGKYKYRSCCGTGTVELGVYGAGVSLYFQFLRQMGLVFLCCALVVLPNLAFNINGNMIVENSALYKYLGMTTIGNLGACADGICDTEEEMQERCMWNHFPCEMKLKDITQWLGLADGVSILLVLAWGIYFKNVHIPWTVRQNDDAHLTPADFTVEIRVLPYDLKEEHRSYKDKLQTHFLQVLQSLGADVGPEAIVEVCLVRDYEGAIKTFLSKGQLILDQQADVMHMKMYENDQNKFNRYEKSAVKKYEKMKKIEHSIQTQAEKSDDERGVVRAFVTFRKASYKSKVLNHYRFSTFTLFRCCQRKELRFAGSPLLARNACEPSDLYWENLDFAMWKRAIRILFVVLLTVILLIICAATLVFFQSLSKSTLASTSEALVWVVKSTPSTGTCLSFCDLEFFNDRLCSGNADTSDDWPTAKVFDQFNDYGQMNSSCSQKWSSPCTSASDYQAACGAAVAGATDWLGFQFETKQQVQCWQATLPDNTPVSEVQIFGCPTAPPPVAERGCWAVEENCAPFYANKELTAASTSWQSLNNKVSADMSCNATIELDVAKARWEGFAEGSEERFLNPIVNCFCQQQVLSVGPAFTFPPYDTEEKKVCEDWIVNNAMVVVKLLGATGMVLIINQILLFIYEYLVSFERHCTVTEVALSQFWKLFLAQMVNTGILVLLVNASLNLPTALAFLRVMNIGSGQFDELSVSWYVSVGTGICITIFVQVFSTTVPPLVMAFIVKPCLACCFKRGEHVEARLQKIYTLPPWNLSLRMAQTLTVVFVICMYSGGMPALYSVGFLYSIVAFWLDKWCLLHGSSKPPAYNEAILQVCMVFLPLAGFLHTVVAGWTFGNTALVPSNWSSLLGIAEILFMSEEDYNQVTTAYRSAPFKAKKELQWRYYNARMMDMAREGCWLIFCIFVVFVTYYVIVWSYRLLLKPFLSPVVFAMKDCCSCKKQAEDDQADTWDDCLKELQKHNMLSSYLLSANPVYEAAAVAIAHGDAMAARRTTERAEPPEEVAL
ncbi:unnamed protein product [Effrenium voratum]|uniref:CSC1/OSCA1-like cytosolic domain-containing protein n=1 Tax=Effrenium voratum TaxID=2562239 RepID=A0AA36HYQ5_9DINO|nr:unnamed protein product [Effrenium voratum]